MNRNLLSFLKCISFLLVACTVILSMTQCKSTEPMTAAHDTYISYGSLGGFAGSYTEYRLMPDGHLYKRTKHKGDFVAMQALDKNQTEQMYQLIYMLQEKGVDADDPGNMTYFVTYQTTEGTEVQVTWGGGHEMVDETVKILYRNLKNLSKDQVILK